MNLLTKKIPTILGLLLIVGGIIGGYYYFQGTKSTTSTEIVPKQVRITNIADNKFTISWISSAPSSGHVEYGIVGEKLAQTAKDERDGNDPNLRLTHHVTVEGLQPSTSYAFRILAGETPTRFDNNGSPYNVTTGPVIGATPSSENFYGKAELPTKQGAEGAIAYLTLPGGATASTLVGSTGNYAFTLSTMRADDLRSYLKYDPSATIGSLTIENGKQQSVSAVSLANAAPVPTITLGQNVDFLTVADAPDIAQVEVVPSPVAAQILNVEPLEGTSVNAVTTGTLSILNPAKDNETLSTLRPEIRGTGPAGVTASIALTGQKSISDTFTIESDGTWSWAPVIDLKAGKQTVTVSYIATGGTATKVARVFTASATTITSDPAFVSTPSASVKASASITPSPTPREVMPATDSGVPVTGVIENTLLTAGLGFVIMVVGAVLLAL